MPNAALVRMIDGYTTGDAYRLEIWNTTDNTKLAEFEFDNPPAGQEDRDLVVIGEYIENDLELVMDVLDSYDGSQDEEIEVRLYAVGLGPGGIDELIETDQNPSHDLESDAISLGIGDKLVIPANQFRLWYSLASRTWGGGPSS